MHSILKPVQNLKHANKYSMRYFKMFVKKCEKGNLHCTKNEISSSKEKLTKFTILLFVIYGHCVRQFYI